MPIHRQICLFARSFWPLTFPVFGLEPSLSWVAPLKATGLPEDKDSVAVQDRDLPRGGLEKKTILRKRLKRKPSLSLAAYPSYALRTLGVQTAVGIPEKESYGVSQRPPSPIIVGLFSSISHPCRMVVQTANLVDS